MSDANQGNQTDLKKLIFAVAAMAFNIGVMAGWLIAKPTPITDKAMALNEELTKELIQRKKSEAEALRKLRVCHSQINKAMPEIELKCKKEGTKGFSCAYELVSPRAKETKLEKPEGKHQKKQVTMDDSSQLTIGSKKKKAVRKKVQPEGKFLKVYKDPLDPTP